MYALHSHLQGRDKEWAGRAAALGAMVIWTSVSLLGVESHKRGGRGSLTSLPWAWDDLVQALVL